MSFVKIFTVFLLCGLSPLSALLSPLYQDIKEIQAILNNKALADFSGEEILAITQEEGGYLIDTTDHLIHVQINKIPSGIGPQKFEVVFQKPIKK